MHCHKVEAALVRAALADAVGGAGIAARAERLFVDFVDLRVVCRLLGQVGEVVGLHGRSIPVRERIESVGRRVMRRGAGSGAGSSSLETDGRQGSSSNGISR